MKAAASAARIGVRLREAMGGMNVQELQRLLEAADAPNSGYSTVARYVKGDSAPPLPWLQAAAAVLGVSHIWLAFGEGDKRRDGALSPDASAIERSTYGHALIHDVRGGRGVLNALLETVLDSRPVDPADEIDDDDLAELMDRLLGPLYRVWYAFRPDASTANRELEGYLLASLTAVLGAVPGPDPKGSPTGRPLTEVLRILEWSGATGEPVSEGDDVQLTLTEGHTLGYLGGLVRERRGAAAGDG